MSLKRLNSITSKENKADTLLLMLVTYGGDAHCAFRLAATIKRHYKQLIVFVPHICKSAGTLVCLAADELVLAANGELGPIDVQIKKEDAFADRSSGIR